LTREINEEEKGRKKKRNIAVMLNDIEKIIKYKVQARANH